MACIFCNNSITANSLEHIIPESLGNKYYVLPRNTICGSCNNSFSKFEGNAITRTFLGFIRTQSAIKTKKGKPSSFQIGDIKGFGDKGFNENIITLEGLTEENSITHSDGKKVVTIPTFEKEESSTSKLALKVGYESLFKSKKEIFNKYDFTNLKKFLLKEDNREWPFITSKHNTGKPISIPTQTDKYYLNLMDCKLEYQEVNENCLLFYLRYGRGGTSYGDIHIIINLLDRDYSWSKPYFEGDKITCIYPKKLYDKMIGSNS
jgi:HNH endonuclease